MSRGLGDVYKRQGYNPVASPIENAHLIGDCQKVGTLKDAITNAYQITKEI